MELYSSSMDNLPAIRAGAPTEPDVDARPRLVSTCITGKMVAR
jgi:hypothetical protein